MDCLLFIHVHQIAAMLPAAHMTMSAAMCRFVPYDEQEYYIHLRLTNSTALYRCTCDAAVHHECLVARRIGSIISPHDMMPRNVMQG